MSDSMAPRQFRVLCPGVVLTVDQFRLAGWSESRILAYVERCLHPGPFQDDVLHYIRAIAQRPEAPGAVIAQR